MARDLTADFEIVGTYRKNLQAMWEDELGIRMVAGQLEGPNESRQWQGSVWVARAVRDPRVIAELQIYAYLRVWAPFSKDATRSPNLPYDPTPLEEMDAKIRAAFAAHQLNLGPWFQQLEGVEFDLINQGLQATILSYSNNAAAEFC